MPKTTLLPCCSGDFCSGQALADALGVSRTAVWKQLNALADYGLEIETVKGRGYRIPGGIDLLNEARVRASLTHRRRACWHPSSCWTRSTQPTQRPCARPGPGRRPAWCAAPSSRVPAGAGGPDLGQPFARNLYVSVVWGIPPGAAALEGLSLAVGVAVARALAAHKLPPVQLWVAQ